MESSTTPPETYTYYHAGPLFTISDLHTNSLLSQAISHHSRGQLKPILPQNLEQRDTHPHSIRDADIRALLACDLALFTYDGSEIDSGTVVEYMIAKFADLPCVILRTDFRGAGDQGSHGDAWNLMSSFWPRTKVVKVDSMAEYKAALAAETGQSGKGENVNVVSALSGGVAKSAGESMIDGVAGKVVEAMLEVKDLPGRMPKEMRENVFTWLALAPGFRNSGDRENIAEMLHLLQSKEQKSMFG